MLHSDSLAKWTIEVYELQIGSTVGVHNIMKQVNRSGITQLICIVAIPIHAISSVPIYQLFYKYFSITLMTVFEYNFQQVSYLLILVIVR